MLLFSMQGGGIAMKKIDIVRLSDEERATMPGASIMNTNGQESQIFSCFPIRSDAGGELLLREEVMA